MYCHPALSIDALCENLVKVGVEIALSKPFAGVHPCPASLSASCGWSPSFPEEKLCEHGPPTGLQPAWFIHVEIPRSGRSPPRRSNMVHRLARVGCNFWVVCYDWGWLVLFRRVPPL